MGKLRFISAHHYVAWWLLGPHGTLPCAFVPVSSTPAARLPYVCVSQTIPDHT